MLPQSSRQPNYYETKHAEQLAQSAEESIKDGPVVAHTLLMNCIATANT